MNNIKSFFKRIFGKKDETQLEKKDKLSSLKTISFKQGTYQGGITLLVILIVVLVNLAAGQLPSSLKSIDLTDEQVLEVSKTSKSFLKDLKDEIQLIVVADKGSTDSSIKAFLEKYADSSSKISIKWTDPVLHPSVLSKYNVEKDTVVVYNKTTKQTTTVSFSDILSSSYDSNYNTVTTFDGDGQLTSAINNLTAKEAMKVYTTEGHGETELPSSVTSLFSKSNYATDTVNTLIDKDLPKDADLLMIYGPTTDFTDDEITQLKDYIADGDKVMVVLSAKAPDLPKLSAFLKDYGLEETGGYVADTSRAYQGQPYYLFPNLDLSGDYANGMSNNMVLILNTKGFSQVDPKIKNVTLTPLMETSASAYDVTEDGQKQGTYLLGAVATQTTASDDSSTSTTDSTAESADDSSTAAEEAKEGKLTVLSSTNMMDDSITSAIATLENSTLFMNMVSANFGNVKNISIEAKTLSANKNTVTNPGSYSLIMILFIPLAILIIGFVIWMKRRKA